MGRLPSTPTAQSFPHGASHVLPSTPNGRLPGTPPAGNRNAAMYVIPSTPTGRLPGTPPVVAVGEPAPGTPPAPVSGTQMQCRRQTQSRHVPRPSSSARNVKEEESDDDAPQVSRREPSSGKSARAKNLAKRVAECQASAASPRGARAEASPARPVATAAKSAGGRRRPREQGTHSDDGDDGDTTTQCSICLEDVERIYMCVPCGHACVCQTCSKGLVGCERGCPICREEVQQVNVIYMPTKRRRRAR